MERNMLSGECYVTWRESLLRNIQSGDGGIKIPVEQNKIPISERIEFKKWDDLYDDEDAKNEVRKAVKRKVKVLEGQQVKGAESEPQPKRSVYSDEDLELIKDVERKLQSERHEGHTQTSIKKEQLFDAYGNISSYDNSSQTSSFHLYNSFQQMMNNVNHRVYQSIPTLLGKGSTHRHVNYNDKNMLKSHPLAQVNNMSKESLGVDNGNIGRTSDSFNDHPGVFQIKNLGNIGQMNLHFLSLSSDTIRTHARPSSAVGTFSQNNESQENRKKINKEEYFKSKSEYNQDNTETTPMDISSDEEELETHCSRKRTWTDFYTDVLPIDEKLQTISVEKVVKRDYSSCLNQEQRKVEVKPDPSSHDQGLDKTKIDASSYQEINEKNLSSVKEIQRTKKDSYLNKKMEKVKNSSDCKKWLPESVSFVPCQDLSQESPPETPTLSGDKVSIEIKNCRQAEEAQDKMLLQTSRNDKRNDNKFQDVSRVLEFGKLKNVFSTKGKGSKFVKENIGKEMKQFFERSEESSESENQIIVEEPHKNPVRKIIVVSGRNSNNQKENGENEGHDFELKKTLKINVNSETKIKSNLQTEMVNKTENCSTTIEWKTKFQHNASKNLPEALKATPLNASQNKTKIMSSCKQSSAMSSCKQGSAYDTTWKSKLTCESKTGMCTISEVNTKSNHKPQIKPISYIVRDLCRLETFGQTSPKLKSNSEIEADLAKLKNTTKAKLELLKKLGSVEPKCKKRKKGQMDSSELGNKTSLKERESNKDKTSFLSEQSVKSPTTCPVTGCPGPGDISLKEHAFREHIPAIFQDNVTDSLEMKVFKCRKRFNILREIAGSIVKESASLDGLVRFFNQGKRLPPIDLSDSLEAIRECCIHHGWKIPTVFKANPINSISVLMNWNVLLYCVKHMTLKQRIAFKNKCSMKEGKENIKSCHGKMSSNVDADRNLEENTRHSATDSGFKTVVSENTGNIRNTIITKCSVKGNKPVLTEKRCVNKVDQSACIVLSSDEDHSDVIESNTNLKKSGVSKYEPKCYMKITKEQENTETNINHEQIALKSKGGCNNTEKALVKSEEKKQILPEDKDKCVIQISNNLDETNFIENDVSYKPGPKQKEQTKEPISKVSDALIMYVCPCGKIATEHDLVFDHLIDQGCKGSIDVVDVGKDKLTLPLLISQEKEDIGIYETDDEEVSGSSDDEQDKNREDAEYIAELTALIDEGNDSNTVLYMADYGIPEVKEKTDCTVELTTLVEENHNSDEALKTLKEQDFNCGVNTRVIDEENFESSQELNKDHPVQLKGTQMKSSIRKSIENIPFKDRSESPEKDINCSIGKNDLFDKAHLNRKAETKLLNSMSEDGQTSLAETLSSLNKSSQSGNNNKALTNFHQNSNSENKQACLTGDGQIFASNNSSSNKEDRNQNLNKHFANKIDPKTSLVWKDGSSCLVPDCHRAKEYFNSFTSFDNHWKFHHIPFHVLKQCSVCGEESKRKYTMKKHVREKHNGTATLISKVLPNEFYINPGSVEKYVHDREWLHQ